MSKTYKTDKGFQTLETLTNAIRHAYARFTDAASVQLDAMRELGSLIYRLENVADLSKLGDAFLNDEEVVLVGKKLTDAFAKFYESVIAVPDTSFISDARARGIAMAWWGDGESVISRELFKKLAPVFRNSKMSYEERAKDASKVMAKALKIAKKKNGGIIIGANFVEARGVQKRGPRGADITPASELVEAASGLVEALNAVRAEDVAGLSNDDRELLAEASGAFVTMLANADTWATTADIAKADAAQG